MKKKYDYIIVGAGLYGAVFANEAQKKGKKCLVIEKRSHIAGNCYTENIEGINVHKYGAHIFHTDNLEIWNYVNKLVQFNRYTNSPLANYKGKLYNLPFNMNTFYQLWGVKTPQEAKAKIDEQRKEFADIKNPGNLEEQALVLGGRDIYEKLIKGYTEKQWGRPATEIPAFIIRRLPFRFTFDNNYFNDAYQGIPVGGYTLLINKMLEDTEVQLNIDFFENKSYFESIAEKIIYTGKIDEYFEYQFGELEYRSLRFETEILDIDNYQGNAVVNYTDKDVPYTRIIEHKHFQFLTSNNTIITKEYSIEHEKGLDPYYPVNNEKNQKRLSKYQKLANNFNHIKFGGRLAEYKYYDMDDTIESCLSFCKTELL